MASFVRRLAAGVLVVGLIDPTTEAVELDVEQVRQAAVTASSARLGEHVELTVSVASVRAAQAAATVVAAPDLGTRVGQPARFTLFADARRRVRVGEATVIVSARAPRVRVRRALSRGEMVSASDVEVHEASLDGERFVPPPLLAEVVGARATRDLSLGHVVAVGDVTPVAAVRAGDRVRAVVRVAPGVEISGVAIALRSGHRHDVVPVMNPESRQTRQARVRGSGEVEIVDAR